MSIRNAIAAFLAPPAQDGAQTDKRNEISSTFFGSKRFVLVIALVAFIYLTYSVLNIELIKVVANVAIFYIIGESLTNLATTIMNGLIKLHEVKTDVEYEKLAAQQTLQKPAAPAAP